MKVKVVGSGSNCWYKGCEGMFFHVFFMAEHNVFFLTPSLFFYPEHIVVAQKGEGMDAAAGHLTDIGIA